MSNPNITIVDGLSNTPIVREMNDNELKSVADRQKEIEAEAKAAATKTKAKAALLAKLGITADEAQLLIG
jgi:hypothetical protein